MAKTYGYSHSAIIGAPIDEVWAWLGDPRRHVELHPMIRELTITAEGEGPGEGERFIDFVVRDDVRLFGVDVPVVYNSRMIQRLAEYKMLLRATCPPRLVTTIVWTLRSVDGGTEVEEQVELTAPRIIAGFSTRQSQRAHESMFATLQRLVAERRGDDDS
jgi:ligand-binding SRPBCC domain-containing protein